MAPYRIEQFHMTFKLEIYLVAEIAWTANIYADRIPVYRPVAFWWNKNVSKVSFGSFQNKIVESE